MTKNETTMKKEMLINVLQPEECRIAIVEDGVLEELYVERSSQESYVGNIYKGRIVNIEASIQAAFIDFGIGRNGFLHVSDVDTAYYKHLLSKDDLAEYEAEMDREYGGGNSRGGRNDRNDRGPRGRDRGDRGPRPAQPMTSWLEPQPPAARTPAPPDEDYPDEFAAGVVGEPAEEVPLAEEVTEFAEEILVDVDAAEELTLETPTRSPVTEAPGEEDDGFGEGIVEETVAAPKAEVTRRPESPRPPVRITPVAPEPAPKRASNPIPEEDDDFGAGIVEGTASANTIVLPAEPFISIEPSPPLEVEHTPPEPPVEAEAVELVESPELGEAESEPKKKSRGRKPKTKPEEAAPEQAADKPKGRRTRKKADGEGDDDSPDDKPKFMGGAERRTSSDDDEPEIRPFFDDGSGFDPDAPNDRFANEPAETNGDAENGFAEPDSTEGAEEEVHDEGRGTPEFDRGAEAETESEPEGADAGVGRGFNDVFEDRRPPGGRGDRDRGDRGDRDRGPPRGGRDRDRDRGPRSGPGGFKGGPKGGRDRGLPKPPIEKIFKRGQEVIVQVIKEAVGTKGPTLSTYISIAGRYLVLMPSLNRVGVSRKIEDHDARKRLREIMTTLAPPKGVGFIVRTAAIDRDARELRNDLAYLLRLWQVVVKRIKRVSGPLEIYRESDMITRTIRDIFTNDIDTIWVDEATAFAHASEFLQIVMPKFASRIRYFESTEPLFHKYGVEDEIVKIHQKRIEMPLGGSLVIEQTEALVAIDVNSGNFRADNNAEETAFQMNMHAAREIARQLRLRDLGGVIVNDFIDMRGETHRRKVEDAFRDALRRDRARTKILRISQFGLIEMTRQRIRPSLKRSIFSDCPHCRGSGFVKTSESLSIDAMRLIQLAAHRAPAIASIQVGVHMDVAHYLLNKRRKELAALEERGKLEVQITGQMGVSPDTLLIRCFDHNGNEVRLLPPPPLPRLAGGKFPPGGRGDRDRGERDRGDRDRGRRYPQPLD
jgi:ribonuclease E